jgi:hypothetical protein
MPTPALLRLRAPRRLPVSVCLLLVSACALLGAVSASAEPLLQAARADVQAFAEWARAPSIQRNSTTALAEGRRLLEARRSGMALLIVEDPAAAVELALPAALRRDLPAELAAGLEQRVDGMGLLTDLVTMYHGGDDDAHAHHEGHADAPAEDLHRAVRRPVAVIGEQRWFAYAAGRRAGVRSLVPVPIHGVALDGHLAIAESPLRPVESTEDLRGLQPAAARSCSARSDLSEDRRLWLSGDRLQRFCDSAELQALEQQWAVFEQQGRDGQAITALAETRSTWTTGPKTFLYIRARFADQDASALPSLQTVTGTVNGMRDLMRDFSYGLLPEINATYTDVVALPKTAAEYSAGADPDRQLLLDAVSAARTVNPAWDANAHNFYAVRFVGGPGSYAGQAYVGAKGIWMKSDNAGVAAHELGHNLGLLHANYWNPASGSFDPVGEGSNAEYGNPYDRLGGGSGGRSHFSASFKERLSWLLDAEVSRLWGSGDYRVAAHDLAAPQPGPLSGAFFGRERLWMGTLRSDQAVPSTVPALQRGLYWLEHRSQYTDFDRAALVNVQGGANHLLDLTARSRGGKNDGGLIIGHTYSDPALDLHLTALARSSSPPGIDFRLQRGPFPGNRAPSLSLSASSTSVATGATVSFQATASDPDGNPLAYAWEWGDGTFAGVNAASQSRSFASAGHYRVRVVASDMRGGRASASVVVTVGTPSTLRASGRVLLNGQPLEGVHVSNGATGNNYRGGYTDSDGRYEITRLASGNLTLSAGLTGYRLSPGFSTPVALNADASGLDFSASALPRVSIAALNDSVAENSGTPLRFRISRSGDTAAVLRVWFDRSGTAFSSGSSGDYSFSTVANRYVEIPAGQASVELAATPIADAQNEPAETVIVSLADGIDYELEHPARAQGRINGSAGPANDAFAAAVQIGGSSATVNGSTAFATLELDEPPHQGRLASSASAWWRWTAPSGGVVSIDTEGSAIDTLLAVYAGDSLPQLRPLAWNNNVQSGVNWARVQLPVQAGQTYRIAVASPGVSNGGAVRLNLALDTSSADALFADGFED